jgi:UDP-N-acetylmuramate dehydrogenase
VGAEEGRLTLGAGAAIVRLINLMRSNGLVGAEFLAGIPGTLGGAVSMNAGTKNGECFRVLEAVELATVDGVGWLEKARIPHAYRHSELPVGSVVTRVRFRLPRGDLAASKQAMDKDLAYRKSTQPLSQPNFGSVFTNPPGDYAGRLIELVNLKGHTLGRAQVSTLHANWIVNLGGATARDVLGLITLMQERVRAETGVELKPEVKRVGEFLP